MVLWGWPELRELLRPALGRRVANVKTTSLCVLCALEFSSCIGFACVCYLQGDVWVTGVQEPGLAWSLWSGYCLAALLFIRVFKWFRSFEMQIQEQEKEETQPLDRRHALLFVGLLSVLIDSVSEWRNPSPADGWHFQVQRPPEESTEAAIAYLNQDWQEKMSRICGLFVERISFGLRINLQILPIAARALRALQLTHFVSLLLLPALATLMLLLSCVLTFALCQAYIFVKIEMPSYRRARAERRQLLSFLDEPSIPRHLLARIVKFVPEKGFPLRKCVPPGPAPVPYVTIRPPKTGARTSTASSQPRLPIDERALLAAVGLLVRRLARMVEAALYLCHSVTIWGARCLGPAIAPNAHPHPRDDGERPETMHEQQSFREWLVVLFCLPAALPLAAQPAAMCELLQLLLFAGVLRNFTLSICEAFICGASSCGEFNVFGFLVTASQVAKFVLVLPSMTLYCALARIFWSNSPRYVIGGLHRAVNGLLRWEIYLHTRPV